MSDLRLRVPRLRDPRLSDPRLSDPRLSDGRTARRRQSDSPRQHGHRPSADRSATAQAPEPTRPSVLVHVLLPVPVPVTSVVGTGARQ